VETDLPLWLVLLHMQDGPSQPRRHGRSCLPDAPPHAPLSASTMLQAPLQPPPPGKDTGSKRPAAAAADAPGKRKSGPEGRYGAALSCEYVVSEEVPMQLTIESAPVPKPSSP